MSYCHIIYVITLCDPHSIDQVRAKATRIMEVSVSSMRHDSHNVAIGSDTDKEEVLISVLMLESLLHHPP